MTLRNIGFSLLSLAAGIVLFLVLSFVFHLFMSFLLPVIVIAVMSAYFYHRFKHKRHTKIRV